MIPLQPTNEANLATILLWLQIGIPVWARLDRSWQRIDTYFAERTPALRNLENCLKGNPDNRWSHWEFTCIDPGSQHD